MRAKWALLCLVFIIAMVIITTIEASGQIAIEPKSGEPWYIAPDELEWWPAGSQGDEIITVHQSTDTSWRFDITPDPIRLTPSEIKNYPFEHYRLAYEAIPTESGTEYIKYKIPVKSPYITYQENKILGPSVACNDYTVDLTDSKGIWVNGPSELLAGTILKYGVHSATYVGVANVLVGVGSPTSRQDWYDYDQTYGWGVIHKNGSTSFASDAAICVGWLDTIPTFWDDSKGSLTFTDLARLPANTTMLYSSGAKFRLGRVKNVTEKTCKDGMLIYGDMVNNGYYELFATTRTTDVINLYNVTMQTNEDSNSDRAICKIMGDKSRIWGCRFDYVYLNNIGGNYPIDIYNSRVTYNYAGGIVNPGIYTQVDSLSLESPQYGLNVSTSGTRSMTNVDFIDCVINDIINFATNIQLHLIDCYFSDGVLDAKWGSGGGAIGAGKSRFYRENTLNVAVSTQSGTPLEYIPINITDSLGELVYSGVTGSGGTIPAQVLRHFKLKQTDGGSVTYSPFLIEIPAQVDYYAYSALFDMDTPKSLEISLTPIESGTSSGDLYDWMVLNLATITWWSENMELIAGILLVFGLLGLAFYKGEWWLYSISSLAAMGWGFYYCEESYVYLGYPLICFGFAVFFNGSYLLFQESKRSKRR